MVKLIKDFNILKKLNVFPLLFFVLIIQAQCPAEVKYSTIPLPQRSYWAPQSLQAGAGLGNAIQAGCGKFLFRWRGTAQHMYKPWLGGVAEIHKGGGLVSSDTLVSTNRYKIAGRLYYSNAYNFMSYVSPYLGIDAGSVRSLKAENPLEVANEGGASQLDVCLEPGMRQGFDVGLEYGLGWRYHPLWTMTFSTSIGIRNDQNYMNESTIGVAYDVTQGWPSLKRGADAIFLFADTLWVLNGSQWEISGLWGLALGF